MLRVRSPSPAPQFLTKSPSSSQGGRTVITFLSRLTKGSRTYCPSRLEPTETCYNLRLRQSRSVSIGHEKFAQLEGPNSCFDKKSTSCSTRKACKKMFSRTRVAALTIAHEEVGDGQEELLLLAYSL